MMYICTKPDKRRTIPFKDIKVGEGFSFPKSLDNCQFGDRDRVYFIKTRPVKVSGKILVNALDAANGELVEFDDDEEVISENMFIKFADYPTYSIYHHRPM